MGRGAVATVKHYIIKDKLNHVVAELWCDRCDASPNGLLYHFVGSNNKPLVTFFANHVELELVND